MAIVTEEEARDARERAVKHIEEAAALSPGNVYYQRHLDLAKAWTRLYDADLWYITEKDKE